ncbi:MAG: glucokinase [candidate division Zixibacteria bacterium]|nr:glucokinase [candidate division Zixibacteria bacterium]
MIAGYITATTTDLARVKIHNGRPQLYSQARYVNRDFSNFGSILSLYLRNAKGRMDVLCLGVAGPVINNRVSATNIPWQIDGPEIEKEYELDRVAVVNDIYATAFGLFQLSDEKFFTINKGKQVEYGNMGLIAAGHGLGEALIYFDGERYCPYASEGGHVDFAPGNQLETELWEYLYSGQGYVETEDVVSLAGLESTFEFMLAANRATKPDWMKKAKDRPAKIIEKALAGSDDIAVKAFDMFVDCYASEAANLALKGMTVGGIFLGGLIAPQIMTVLDKGRFMERFVKKGKMGSLLADMPVGLIIEDRTALLGAASIAMEMVSE